jgi:hypothetical protein
MPLPLQGGSELGCGPGRETQERQELESWGKRGGLALFLLLSFLSNFFP